MGDINENTLPEGWGEVCLGDVCDIIGGGTPKTKVKEYWNGNIPWLSVVDFNNNNRWVKNTEKRITLKGLNESSTKLLSKGDIIISARGTVGALAQLKLDMAFNQSCYGLRAKDDLSENNYLYYLLKFSLLKISKNVHGAVFDTITRETFDFINVKLPPINEQKKIANLLSSFDNKIELLEEQNKTLEEIAQTIFKEWFGKYQLGDELPEGWRIGKLEDLVFHLKNNVKPYKESEFVFKHFSIPAFDKGKIPINEIGKSILSNKYRVEDFTILVSKLNPFTPRIWTIINCDDKSICSTEFQVLKPTNLLYFSYIVCVLKSSEFTDCLSQKVQGTSSSHQRVKPQDILDVEIIIPTTEYFITFRDLILPILFQIDNNIKQTINLKETRDKLLPKLMNGTIRL